MVALRYSAGHRLILCFGLSQASGTDMVASRAVSFKDRLVRDDRHNTPLMNRYLAEPLLNEPIANLALSEEFRLVAETLGFHALADLLEHHMADLLALPGFDHRIWNEYAAFLEHHRIGHYLD